MFIHNFKRKAFAGFALVLALASNEFSQSRQREEREATPEQRKPFYEMAKRYLSDEKGRVRMDLWTAGADEFDKLPRSTWTLPSPNQKEFIPVNFSLAAANAAFGEPSSGTVWRSLGPAPLRNIYYEPTIDSGEVVGIAIDPRGESDRVMYLATGWGGIWKTTDGGGLWQPTTDNMPSLSMGAVALDIANPDIVYAGTGNGYQSTSDPENWERIKGIGIYKSTDGGGTWQIKGRDVFGARGFRPGATIYKILSAYPNAILVATDNGLFYSINGGDTFGSNVPTFDNGRPVVLGEVRDLAVDTASQNVIYATVSGLGIVRSLNYGITFDFNLFKLRSGEAKPGTPANGTFGALWFAQSRFPNNRTMFASVAGGGNSYNGLYKSLDGGGSWVRLGSLDTVTKQIPYDVTIGVDPTNPAKVYAGFVALWRSDDGGGSFTVAGDSLVHADHHAIAFSPPSHFQARRVNPTVYAGSDGGIYSSADSGGSWSVRLNQTLSTNLIIDFSMGKNDSRYMYTGIWDHGIVSRAPSDASTSWRRGNFGDGANVAVDPANAMICYHSSGMMGPSFIRTLDGGHSWNEVVGLDWTPDRIFFVPRASGGRVVSSDLYAARGRDLYRINTASHRGAVTSARVASLDDDIHRISYSETRPEVVWATTTSGVVWRTLNINAATSDWTRKGAPGGMRVAAVAAHPRDPEQACAVFAGFSDARAGLPTRHVFCTQDGGATWKDIGGTLTGRTDARIPDLPVYDAVLIDDPRFPRLPPKVIAATEAGVVINDGTFDSPSWRLLGSGLPKSACTRFQYVPSSNTLAVSVWGRGIFRFGG